MARHVASDVLAPVDDVTAAVSGTLGDPGLVAPVDGVASSLTDTLSDPGLVAPVDGVASSLTDTLGDPGLLAPVDDVTAAVSGTLGDSGLVAPVDGLADAVVPFTSTVAAVPASLGEGVDAMVVPFTMTVGGLPGALVGAGPGAGSGDPFAVTVAPSASAGPAPVDAAGPATPGPDTAPQHSLADGAATTAAPAAAGTAAPDVGPFAHEGVLGGVGLPGGASDVGSFAAVHGSGAGAAIAAPGELAPLGAPPISGADASALPVAAPPVDSESVLGVVAQVGQDTRIVAAAAVMTFAAATVIGPRAGGSGADARMAFTNVRLLPCLLKEAAGRQLTAITEGLAPVAAPAYAALSDGAAAGSPIVRDAAAVKAEHAVGVRAAHRERAHGGVRARDPRGDGRSRGRPERHPTRRAGRDAARCRLPGLPQRVVLGHSSPDRDADLSRGENAEPARSEGRRRSRAR